MVTKARKARLSAPAVRKAAATKPARADVQDTICRDNDCRFDETFEGLKDTLAIAFAEPDSEFVRLSADASVARAKARRAA